MSSVEPLPIVYTAHTKRRFYCRDAVCEFVFAQGAVPLNAFRAFEYFLADRAPRDLVRQAHNNLVRISDEMWAFGEIDEGVLFEMLYARRLGKTVRCFSIGDRAQEIHPTSIKVIEFEPDVIEHFGARELLIEKIIGVGG
jgi:hypothetical protein